MPSHADNQTSNDLHPAQPAGVGFKPRCRGGFPVMTRSKLGTEQRGGAVRRYVFGPLIVAAFVGSGYLASGYFQPAPVNAPTQADRDSRVWKDLEQQRPAQTPEHDNTERRI